MEYDQETESVTFSDGKETHTVHKDDFFFEEMEGPGPDGKPVTRRFLRAKYGEEGHLITVPIDGDEHAQALHYAKRDDKDRETMKRVLTGVGAWRLDDDGNVPQGA